MDTFECGHPKTPDNITVNGRRVYGRCKTCHKAQLRAAYQAIPKDIRQLQGRLRRLPGLLEKARKQVTMLESEARRYGMDELFREDVA